MMKTNSIIHPFPDVLHVLHVLHGHQTSYNFPLGILGENGPHHSPIPNVLHVLHVLHGHQTIPHMSYMDKNKG